MYRCDWGDCTRTFVRLDLCNRHRDRHTAKGSALNRKDSLSSSSFVGPASPGVDGRQSFSHVGSISPEANRPHPSYGKFNGAGVPYPSPKDAVGGSYIPMTHTPPAGYSNGHHPNPGDYMHHDGAYHNGPGQRGPHQSPAPPPRPSVQTNGGQYMSPVPAQSGYHSQAHTTPQSSGGASGAPQYVPPQNFAPFTLPPSDFSSTSTPASREPQQTYAPLPACSEYSEQDHQQQSSDMMLLDQMSAPTTVPIFGPTDSMLNKSPYVGMPEDFMAYLFNTAQSGEGSPMISSQLPAYKYVKSHTTALGPFGCTRLTTVLAIASSTSMLCRITAQSTRRDIILLL